MYRLSDIYKQLREEEQAAQVSQYKIYCDMDGVLCDFDKRFEQFGGMNPNAYKEKFGGNKFWNLINQVGAQFWSKMPWMPEGKQLWDYIKQYNPKLLSAPSEDYSSRYGKKLWVQENVPGTKLILAKRENKRDYASGKSILIDDREDTINEWRAAKGIGILFTSTDQTINELKKTRTMSKYKYRLVENEGEGGGEESGLKGVKTKNELFLTSEEGLTADDLIKIINDPKNLEGVYAIESGDLKDLKLKVFGDRPNIMATIKTNIEIYKNNGKSFYTKIETETGEKFDKKGAIIKKDKTGNTIFVFPQLNKHNEELVRKYFNLTSDKQAKKSNLTYIKVNNNTLKFPVSDELSLKKILKKAGLTNYTLEKKEVNENLREIVQKLIKQSYGR